MKVKLISAKLTTGYCKGKTKPDRRFKTGVRIISEPYMYYNLTLRLTNPGGRFRVSENILTQYGAFRVVSCNFLPLDGEMELRQLYATLPGHTFEFNAEIEVASAGFVCGESASYSTSNPNFKTK